MADRTRGYAHRIDILAPSEQVWLSLIDPRRLAEWYVPGVRLSPKKGGSVRIRLDATIEREAMIDVFEPGSRLRLIYLPMPAMPPTEAVLIDDFIISREGDAAVLRLLGSGFPEHPEWDQLYARLRNGWGIALSRLKLILEGQLKPAAK
jgi:uncharacterized protein YndB with AHSA1/START domain